VDRLGFERLRVAMLHDALDEKRRLVWSLSLMSLGGEPVALCPLGIRIEEAPPLAAAEERLSRQGMFVEGDWINSPDNYRPRYYAPVLVRRRRETGGASRCIGRD
jgi:hypothetical protein